MRWAYLRQRACSTRGWRGCSIASFSGEAGPENAQGRIANGPRHARSSQSTATPFHRTNPSEFVRQYLSDHIGSEGWSRRTGGLSARFPREHAEGGLGTPSCSSCRASRKQGRPFRRRILSSPLIGVCAQEASESPAQGGFDGRRPRLPTTVKHKMDRYAKSLLSRKGNLLQKWMHRCTFGRSAGNS
jgi:hypothetical protein